MWRAPGPRCWRSSRTRATRMQAARRPMSEHWALMVHGGARTIAPERADANRAGCLAAVRAGQAILAGGGSAIDAVVAAIRMLEDDPTFNAGTGSVRNSDGDIECDAALVDGR